MDKETVRIRCPERITEELIERLPADKLCRKYIDGELASDMENKVFDSIMCAVELHAEVINGGFNQYYYNSGGERAQKAEDTFVKLGADRIADVVKRANNQYAANRMNCNRYGTERRKDSPTAIKRSSLMPSMMSTMP